MQTYSKNNWHVPPVDCVLVGYWFSSADRVHQYTWSQHLHTHLCLQGEVGWQNQIACSVEMNGLEDIRVCSFLNFNTQILSMALRNLS